MRFRIDSLVACSVLAVALARADGPRNIILCIGDGMGDGPVATARCFAGTNLVFEAFPYRTHVTTSDASGGITDSAAAGTAIATGHKVNLGVLSLAVPGDESELETLLEACKRQGKSTGLITTCYLTDATPAAFGSHVMNRYTNAVEIAWQYLNRSCPDVLFGGGAAGLDAYAADEAGYAVVTDRASLQAVVPVDGLRLCGVFGWGYLPFETDGLGELPRLEEMVTTALAVLERDPDGFFLMLEGGMIDLACHGNDITRCVGETLGFDAAIRAVMRWAQGREGDTLVLVTADHDTGGLHLVQDNGPGNLPEVSWLSADHTAAPVGLYGWGATAHLVSRVRDNTQIGLVARSPVPEPGEGIGIVCAAPGRMMTSWATVSGAVCYVECASDLDTPQWQTLATVTAESARVSFVDTNAATRTRGFYRLR